jgi:hypothetical protein
MDLDEYAKGPWSTEVSAEKGARTKCSREREGVGRGERERANCRQSLSPRGRPPRRAMRPGLPGGSEDLGRSHRIAARAPHCRGARGGRKGREERRRLSLVFSSPSPFLLLRRPPISSPLPFSPRKRARKDPAKSTAGMKPEFLGLGLVTGSSGGGTGAVFRVWRRAIEEKPEHSRGERERGKGKGLVRAPLPFLSLLQTTAT